MECRPPGSSVHGILQARILEWGAIPFSRGSSPPRIELRFPPLQADSLPSEPAEKPVWWVFKWLEQWLPYEVSANESVADEVLHSEPPSDIQYSKGASDCLWRVWLRRRGRNISAGLSHVSRKSSGCPSEHLSPGPLRRSLCLTLAAPRGAKETARLIQVDLGTGLQAPCPGSFPLRQWPEPSGRRQGAGRALLIHWAFPRLWEPERGQVPARRPGCVRREFPALLPQGRVNGINSSQRPHISSSLDQLWLGQSSLWGKSKGRVHQTEVGSNTSSRNIQFCASGETAEPL